LGAGELDDLHAPSSTTTATKPADAKDEAEEGIIGHEDSSRRTFDPRIP
jgi:hypothetical protein